MPPFSHQFHFSYFKHEDPEHEHAESTCTFNDCVECTCEEEVARHCAHCYHCTACSTASHLGCRVCAYVGERGVYRMWSGAKTRDEVAESGDGESQDMDIDPKSPNDEEWCAHLASLQDTISPPAGFSPIDTGPEGKLNADEEPDHVCFESAPPNGEWCPCLGGMPEVEIYPNTPSQMDTGEIEGEEGVHESRDMRDSPGYASPCEPCICGSPEEEAWEWRACKAGDLLERTYTPEGIPPEVEEGEDKGVESLWGVRLSPAGFSPIDTGGGNQGVFEREEGEPVFAPTEICINPTEEPPVWNWREYKAGDLLEKTYTPAGSPPNVEEGAFERAEGEPVFAPMEIRATKTEEPGGVTEKTGDCQENEDGLTEQERRHAARGPSPESPDFSYALVEDRIQQLRPPLLDLSDALQSESEAKEQGEAKTPLGSAPHQ